MPSLTSRLTLLLLMLGVTASAQAKLNVFACEPEWAALTRSLAGEYAEVFSATHAGQDPHHIQARPSLIARYRSADLAVCTGAELEIGWMPMLQRRARNPGLLPGEPGFFEAARQVALMEQPVELDRSGGDLHADGNPHIQLDPRRILEVAKALTTRLQELDRAHSSIYGERLQDFSQRWQASMKSWQTQAKGVKGKRVVVHHREWVYLLDWLGMQRVASLEPKPGIPPNLAHLSQLKEQSADLIIVSPMDDPKPSDWLHEQTGQTVVVLPHTVGAVPGTDDLFGLFDEITRRLSLTVNE